MLRGLDHRISDETDLPVHLVDAPLECVVLGAGRCLESFDSLKGMFMARFGSARNVMSVAVIDPAQLQAEVDSFAWYHSIDLGHGVVDQGPVGDGRDGHRGAASRLPRSFGARYRRLGRLLLVPRRAARCVAGRRARSLRLGCRLHRAHAVLERVLRNVACCPISRATPPTSGAPTFPAGAGSTSRTACSRAGSSPSSPTSRRWTSSTLGTFDIVLYLGVLYHMKEPLTCLERLRAVTREVAVIETVAAQVPGNAGRSLLELHAGGELNADFGNWYVPTVEALRLARARVGLRARRRACAARRRFARAAASPAGSTSYRRAGPTPPPPTTAPLSTPT